MNTIKTVGFFATETTIKHIIRKFKNWGVVVENPLYQEIYVDIVRMRGTYINKNETLFDQLITELCGQYPDLADDVEFLVITE